MDKELDHDRRMQRLLALTPLQRRELEQTPRQKEAVPNVLAPAAVHALPPIPQRPPADSYPLSLGQERLWLFEQIHPGSPVCNLPFEVGFAGPLQVAALERALAGLEQRHEALRTRFVQVGGRPAQVIDPPRPLALPVVDLTALPPPGRRAERERLAGEEARRPFDLRGRPLRVVLVHLDGGEHVLFVALPHIVSDAWSAAVFCGDLGELYAAALAGCRADLPRLPVQPADHAVWQRERLRSADLAPRLEHWKRRLEGCPLDLDLPADRPFPRDRSFAAGRLRLEVAPYLESGLRRMAGLAGASPFMVLLAAFGALLGRYTGGEDLLVTTPHAGRERPEVEGLIGCFANLLALRLDLSGDPPFHDYLARVGETCLEAFADADLPFEKVTEALAPERDPDRPLLARAVFAFQSVPARPIARDLGDLALASWRPIDTRTAKVDLMFTFWGPLEGLEGWLDYSAERFDRATAARVAGHLVRLLDAVLADPRRRVSELPLLSDAERQALLVEPNAIAARYPSRLCVHELFQAWAERSPEAVAVDGPGGGLTYGELARRVRRLARRLRRLGVRPETPVALAAGRSAAAVAGTIAVLEAGGACLPLDPSYPEARLRWLLEDSGAGLLLATAETEPAVRGLVAGLPLRTVRIDVPGGNLAAVGGEGEEADSPARPGNLAYLIYSSGSAGLPKAVMVEHRGLPNLVMAQVRALQIGPEDRVLQFSSPASDASIWEIWMALATGARLCLGGRDDLLPGPGLVRLLAEQEVTHLLLPPSALAALPPAELPALRVLCSGGEACTPDLVRRWAPGRRFWNAYGPTEATVCATLAELRAGEEVPCAAALSRPPVGRPLPNVRAYVLDARLWPVPVGVPGELCLAGVGLARGYLGRPAWTAERFVPEPYGPAAGAPPGSRLYRTGDLVRMLPDGRIDFLGRTGSPVEAVAGLAAAAVAYDHLGGAARGADDAMSQTSPAASAATPSAPPRIEDIYGLSPLQAGMLFHTLYAPRSGIYVEQFTCRLEGPLDEPALEAAWRGVVARHPVLRTSFHLEELERPLQVVHAEADLPWRREDWRGLAAAEQERRLAVHLEEDAARGFDLAVPPLTRLLLARLGEESWRFVWSHHHLILDGWSFPLLLSEVFALYEAFVRGGPRRQVPAGLLPPVRPYRLFIDWLAQQDPAAAEAFWRRELAGFAAPTPLGIERGGAVAAGGQQDRVRRLAPEATSRLQGLARQARVTPNTVLAGAWALLLGRYSGEGEVLFGSVTSARPPHLAAGATLLGLLLNTLPVRIRIEPEAPLLPWLHALQARQAELSRFAYASLAEIQGWSEVPRGTPLFESLFTFENYPRNPGLEERGAGGVRPRDLRTIERTNYPLSLTVVPDERLLFQISFDRARFDAPAAERMLGHLETLLAAMVTDPERPAASLPILTAPERSAVLCEWNDTEGTLDGRPVHEQFAAWAARTPEAPAVVFDGGEVSYGELDRRASALAWHLAALGVGPEVRVAVALDRSPELPMTLLAIWKAGGVYVPLDPTYPPERLLFFLGDSGAAVVVTRAAFAEGLAGNRGLALPALVGRPGLRIVRLDADAAVIAAREGTGRALEVRVEPEMLAYILYTSGSTGRPKGVGISQRALANLAQVPEQLPGYPARAGDRVLQLASPSFDVSIWEMVFALVRGAELHLAPIEKLAGEALGRLLAERSITYLTLTPGVLASVPWRELPALRVLDFGGDALPAELVRRWASGRRVWNSYGPTEAAITATVAELAGDGSKPPIGRAVLNLRTLVLDARLEPAPVGVAGELCLAGIGLARGYPGRPDLTAERFLPDPFSAAPGGRLYRTGDRVHWLADGRLDFRGRLDRQVKVRGVRIEPGEVEAALAAHPAVREAAVVATDAVGGAAAGKRLVAYVAADRDLAAGELRAFLQETLPDAMVPSAFAVLGQLPRTPAGKIDRQALASCPAPEANRPEVGKPVGARTPAEEALVRIWAEVLGVERVGVHDNFFDLGGDSILSLQVVGRAAEAGFRLDPRLVFEHPTIAELAAIAPLRQPEGGEDSPIGPAQCTPIQRWLFEQELDEPHHWNMGLLIELPQRLPPGLLSRAVAAVFSHHDALRARFRRDGARWWQEVAPAGGPIPFAVVDLSVLPSALRPAAVEAACEALQRGFDLAQGRLFRSVLFETATELPRLLLLAHHLVVDAFSWRVLLADLESACGQLRRGEPVLLAAKTTAFRRWAAHLAEHARSEALRSELPHWEATVQSGAPLVPVDFAGGANVEGSTRQLTTALDVESTQALLKRVPGVYRTEINDVLLTALVEALAPWTGERVLLFDLEGHGREPLGAALDLSRTVGWFTTVFPVRLDLRGAAGPGEALKAVKEQLRAVPGRGIGYGLLRYLGGDPGVGERLRPAFPPQVLFNYLGQLDPGLSTFRLATECAGLPRDPRGPRSHLLEINAHVLAGRLEVAWSYSENVHRRDSVERVAERFLAELGKLIDHCLSPGAGGFTPSDFPGAELDQKGLDKFLAQLRRPGSAGAPGAARDGRG